MNIESNFSSLWLSLVALAGGLGILIAGGETLVSGAVRLANRLGMRPLLIGLTVVAFGTSMPELFVSINASLSNHSDIMFGNVVGSNIANVGLVLALSAVLSPLVIRFSMLKNELLLIIVSGLLVFGLTFLGFFPRIVGFLFAFVLVVYTITAYRREAKENGANGDNDTAEGEEGASYSIIVGLILAGLVLMWFGSDYFIKGAVDIARFFGLSELIIGLTLAAVGTSLPELASSISAIRRGESDILVGNIVGSNLFNILLVLGGTATIKPFLIPGQAASRDLPLMLAYTIVLIPLSLYGGQIKRWHGVTLLVGYLAYIYSLA